MKYMGYITGQQTLSTYYNYTLLKIFAWLICSVTNTGCGSITMTNHVLLHVVEFSFAKCGLC